MNAKQFIVTMRVSTNVTLDDNTMDALTERLEVVRKAMGYGLGDLVDRGEYRLDGIDFDVIPMTDDDDDGDGEVY